MAYSQNEADLENKVKELEKKIAEAEKQWDLTCQGWHFELEGKEKKLKIAIESLKRIKANHGISLFNVWLETTTTLEKIEGGNG